ncbi:piggyBac transposable element-derived protein 4-like [Oreochromis aureus]|uniref:piggyBac transposable element-derived protein 4-like n=1 Tax=Oreochromis aureus TaxID=47969 RepID=UPI00195486CE|nr:piggyBac transposable element-derived protein 4-like [Oreochromis aureus]
MAFFPPEIEDTVIAMTNLEASRRRLAIDGWKTMDRAEFRAYLGLLILAGVYRSRGEACESLWDSESGRSVFRAVMPLKTFRAYSSALRFDDRETREPRRVDDRGRYDKLAPIRAVWDEWCARLPVMYRPGPEVTVDERLVPFRGRCPFRQYMPSKPARYGIKIWVLCDSRSSYAWKMQLYAGKADKLGPPEKNLAARVVMDLTEGLAPGHNVTCDNFFTSRELAARLFRERGHTLLGTLRANRPEIPRELRCVKGRPVGSAEIAVLRGDPDGRSPHAVVMSYVAKKNKNVLLLTTSPRYLAPSGSLLEPSCDPDGGAPAKPLMVLHYNRTKGGVDNLDKVVGTYSCRRKTLRWPVALFHNMVDVAAYNAFVVWRETRPDWMSGKLNKRRLFLERLGKALVLPTLEARRRRGTRGPQREEQGEDAAVSESRSSDEPQGTPVKRQRCRVCPRSKDVKTKIVCFACRVHVCSRCALTYCPTCAAAHRPVQPGYPDDNQHERPGPRGSD